MNNKCFTTNYQREVNNDNLPYVGEIKFKVVYGDQFNFANLGDENMHVVADGDIQGIVSGVGDTVHTAREFTVPKGSWFNASIPVGTTVKVYPRYCISGFSGVSDLGSSYSYKEMDISQLAYMTKATNIEFPNNGQSLNLLKSTYGDIKAIATDISLTCLDVSNTNVSGDIAAVKDLTSLDRLDVSNTNISGDIAAVKNLTSLTFLNVSSTKVSGDIAAVKDLTSLTTLYINSKVSGDIAAVKNLTSLTKLVVGFTKVSGDIAAVKNLTSLTILITYNMPNLTGDISALSALTHLKGIDLEYTPNVTGDISSIMNLPNIEYVHLPDTITHTDEQVKTLTDKGITVVFTTGKGN